MVSLAGVLVGFLLEPLQVCRGRVSRAACKTDGLRPGSSPLCRGHWSQDTLAALGPCALLIDGQPIVITGSQPRMGIDSRVGPGSRVGR